MGKTAGVTWSHDVTSKMPSIFMMTWTSSLICVEPVDCSAALLVLRARKIRPSMEDSAVPSSRSFPRTTSRWSAGEILVPGGPGAALGQPVMYPQTALGSTHPGSHSREQRLTMAVWPRGCWSVFPAVICVGKVHQFLWTSIWIYSCGSQPAGTPGQYPEKNRE